MTDVERGIGEAKDVLMACTLAVGLLGVASVLWMWACR
jgi:hypothetical protein